MSIEPILVKSAHPLYVTWTMMKQRCYNPNATSAPYYHGLGITVCDRWRDDFWNFVSDMGPKPHPDHTLERLDSAGNYCPANCVWADSKQQAKTRRSGLGLSNNKPRGIRPLRNRIHYDGKVWSCRDLAAAHDLKATTLGSRLQRGWDVASAVTTPLRPSRHH